MAVNNNLDSLSGGKGRESSSHPHVTSVEDMIPFPNNPAPHHALSYHLLSWPYALETTRRALTPQPPHRVWKTIPGQLTLENRGQRPRGKFFWPENIGTPGQPCRGLLLAVTSLF